MAKERERPVDVCPSCAEEGDETLKEIVAYGLCRRHYQQHWRDEQSKREKHGKTKQKLKLELDTVKFVSRLVEMLHKARHTGILDELKAETRDAVSVLVQELVELERKLVGKSPSAIFEETVEEAARGREEFTEEEEPEAPDMDFDEAARVLQDEGKVAREVLGVTEDATWTEIKSAYRKLVKRYHPDTTAFKPEVAEPMFRRVMAAYAVLKRDFNKEEVA